MGSRIRMRLGKPQRHRFGILDELEKEEDEILNQQVCFPCDVKQEPQTQAVSRVAVLEDGGSLPCSS